MIRRALIALAFLAGLGACTDLGQSVATKDEATVNASGTWDVTLKGGGTCYGLSALRAEDAIALCRLILSLNP